MNREIRLIFGFNCCIVDLCAMCLWQYMQTQNGNNNKMFAILFFSLFHFIHFVPSQHSAFCCSLYFHSCDCFHLRFFTFFTSIRSVCFLYIFNICGVYELYEISKNRTNVRFKENYHTYTHTHNAFFSDRL